MAELTKAQRIKLIRQALEHCGQPVTDDAIAEQYYYETHRSIYSKEEDHEQES